MTPRSGGEMRGAHQSRHGRDCVAVEALVCRLHAPLTLKLGLLLPLLFVLRVVTDDDFGIATGREISDHNNNDVVKV